MQPRDCVTVSNSPKSPTCPLQVQIMLISYHLTLSTLALASRPADRFLCRSGASDCLGPSLTKQTILGGSGGSCAPGNFKQLCCFRLHFQGRYIENQIEYDIIFQGLPQCAVWFSLSHLFFFKHENDGPPLPLSPIALAFPSPPTPVLYDQSLNALEICRYK